VHSQEYRPWHGQSPAQIADHWRTDLKDGLTLAQAGQIRASVGPNALVEKPPPTLISRLIAQVSDATVLALIGAAGIAAIVGYVQDVGLTFIEAYGDSVAIMAIVILNAILGLVQEQKAERALAALKQMTSPQAEVVREGKVMRIPASEVVPGDLLRLKEGDKVTADARVLRGTHLEVMEAALTGESMPVFKQAADELAEKTPLAERSNMVFMGTEVTRGRARAIVVNTAMHTELGKIATMLAELEEQETPLQRYLNRFGRQIVIACLVISGIVFLAGLLQGLQTVRELFLTAVSLAVAAIPEGLPAITTIVLALGTQRMAKRNALVRRLSAVEGLGSAQVICTDKTGTLTQNQMTVRRVFAGGRTCDLAGGGRSTTGAITRDGVEVPLEEQGEALRLLFSFAAWTPETHLLDDGAGQVRIVGNPTDGALAVAARKANAEPADFDKVVSEIHFTSARKMATVVIREGDQEFAIVRGAPEVLLARATQVMTDAGVMPMDPAFADAFKETAVAWGDEAMRVMALATRSAPVAHEAAWESELTLLGMLGIVDPPREEVAAAIREARGAGIQTMMITGDHPATANAIGRQLGVLEASSLVLTGSELDMLDQQQLEAQVDRVRVVARATPLHKLRIVEALKARGVVCAMTGDGVNDAPAVKAASIGVAMGNTGTEVTKEAADLVLADDNYATIVAAVEEGRAIFANIRKFILFLLSSNMGIVLVVFAAGLLGWAPPLLPIQILWINLVTNGLPALALGVEPPEPNLMAYPPRDPRTPILTRREFWVIGWVGVIMALCSLTLFALLIEDPANHLAPSLRLAQTGAFAVLSISPMFHAFNCRSASVSNFRLGWTTNRALWGAILVGTVLMAVAVFIPALNGFFRTQALGLHEIALIALVSAVPLLLGELRKLLWPRPLVKPALANSK
jgi:Ca2+-transporting ATPase